MFASGLLTWLITELALFSIAIYAFKNPAAVGALVNTGVTGIGGVTHALEGRG